MSEEKKWTWWVGNTEEIFSDQCQTREEAVRIASVDYGGAWIAEATPPDTISLSEYFDKDFVEEADCRADDDYGSPDHDETMFDITPEQERDLVESVRATMDEWQKRHGLVFKGWRFGDIRNREFIPAAD